MSRALARPSGWILDKSAAARANRQPVSDQLAELVGNLYLCQAAQLEQLYSARSATEYDARATALGAIYHLVPVPADVLDRALALQRDLAHHHGMWHRIPIPDLIIAETAVHHGLGVVHVDADYDRISEVRPLVSRRLSAD